jgi:arylsulfatase A-like enzyme
MKNTLLKLLVVSVVLSSCSQTQVIAQNESKPNIIFIVTDDLGWSDLGCYGADLHETPNIDKLAEKSMVFTNSYAAGSVCSPTRASIMTGKTPAKLNYTVWSEAATGNAEEKRLRGSKYLEPLTLENLPLEEISIAEKLKDKDYLTAHVGKWHIGDYMHFPNTQGFDVSVASSQRRCSTLFLLSLYGNCL